MNKKIGNICILMMLVLPLVAISATGSDCEIEGTVTDSVEGNIETLFKDGNKTYVFIEDRTDDKGIGYVFLDVSITDYATLMEAENDNSWITIFYTQTCDGCYILAIHVSEGIDIDTFYLPMALIIGLIIGFFIGLIVCI